jgi:hypothetical protein
VRLGSQDPSARALPHPAQRLAGILPLPAGEVEQAAVGGDPGKQVVQRGIDAVPVHNVSIGEYFITDANKAGLTSPALSYIGCAGCGYCPRYFSAACAVANRATGTRKGEQLT